MTAQTPRILYKYVRPERIDILETCRIRFTQRKFFEDKNELQPDYDCYGTFDEIRRQIENAGALARIPGLSIDQQAYFIASSQRHQARALAAAVNNIQSIRQIGILCLTVSPVSQQMWNEYADGANGGFVIGFNTQHAGFIQMTAPMGARQVVYSSEGFPSFLGMIEKNPYEPLYRKQASYSYEQEWRSLRLLKNLEERPNEVFLAVVEPASICEVWITRESSVRTRLDEILTGDTRFRHVTVSVCLSDSCQA